MLGWLLGLAGGAAGGALVLTLGVSGMTGEPESEAGQGTTTAQYGDE